MNVGKKVIYGLQSPKMFDNFNKSTHNFYSLREDNQNTFAFVLQCLFTKMKFKTNLPIFYIYLLSCYWLNGTIEKHIYYHITYNTIYNRDCNTQIQILYLSISFYAFKYIFVIRSQYVSPDSQEGSIARKRLTTPALWGYRRKWNDYNKWILRNRMWKWRVNYAGPIQSVMESLASVLNLPHKGRISCRGKRLSAFQEVLCNLTAHEMYFCYGR
jgi:hypothetical protein